MKLSGNKILITGGATGIGYGLAERFIREGNRVIICGRRQEALDEARKLIPSLEAYRCDLSVPDERLALMEWVKQNHPDLNVLVNNAGIQNWMSLSDTDFYERSLKEIETNITAPLHLTSLFISLPSLQAIMNVTSGLSFVPLAKVPVYCATKAFVHSFTLSTRALLKSRRVEVVEIIPPALNTDLGGKGIHDQAPPVSEFIDAIFKQLAEGKNELSYGFSETVSRAGADVLQAAFSRMNQGY